jgi:hypothetical protein
MRYLVAAILVAVALAMFATVGPFGMLPIFCAYWTIQDNDTLARADR